MDTVTCTVCGRHWAIADPGVRYWYIDREWCCTDEAQCFAYARGLIKEE